MTGSPRAEETRLLAVAAVIAEGAPVNWDEESPAQDAHSTAVLGHLRALETMSRMSHPVRDKWGSYSLGEEVGRGSYGTVYRAFDSNLRLEVALKVIGSRPGKPCTDASKALHEARLLAKISHPNVVRVYRAECIGLEMGLAMEFVHGRTLKERLSHEGPFSAREAMVIGIDLCRALAAVHAAGLVHGDIKAENVMRAVGGRTVLMDFGAGYDVNADFASGRRVLGTPVYLAPEVFNGVPRTTVSDIYSMGVLLYYLATGAYPLGGHSRSEVWKQHQARAPRRLLRDVRPDLPDEFIRVVDRAMSTRPDQRHQTAGELEAALNWALKSEEPATVTPRRLPAAPKWAVAAAGIVAVGFGVWSAREDALAPASLAMSAATPVQAPSTPVAVAPDSYRIEAAFYRERGGAAVRLASGARVARGDQLSLRVTSSVPAYVYVINEDDRGEAYLLFPLPGQQQANPLQPGVRHQIPGVVNGEQIFWTVSSAGGREHFLIFASPQPLSPAFERVLAALPTPSHESPAAPLPAELRGMLRGVGGLSKAAGRQQGAKLNDEFGTPLSETEETARGIWVRQLTLENPR